MAEEEKDVTAFTQTQVSMLANFRENSRRSQAIRRRDRWIAGVAAALLAGGLVAMARPVSSQIDEPAPSILID